MQQPRRVTCEGGRVWAALTCSPDATGLLSPGAQDTGFLCYRALYSAGWDRMGPLGETPQVLTRGVSRELLGAAQRSRTISPDPSSLPAFPEATHREGWG